VSQVACDLRYETDVVAAAQQRMEASGKSKRQETRTDRRTLPAFGSSVPAMAAAIVFKELF
jgi:hypothetical protein